MKPQASTHAVAVGVSVVAVDVSVDGVTPMRVKPIGAVDGAWTPLGSRKATCPSHEPAGRPLTDTDQVPVARRFTLSRRLLICAGVGLMARGH